MTDHLRTGGNAGFNCLQHQLHIQTSLFGNRKALRDTGNLDRAHQVVDQLVNRAGTDRTEMPDRGRERREYGRDISRSAVSALTSSSTSTYASVTGYA